MFNCELQKSFALTSLRCVNVSFSVGPDTITRRELKYLTDSLALPSSKLRNSVEYKKMTDLLSATRESTVPRENWNEGDYDVRKSVSKRGTVGDFLEHASCPMEQKNYRRLISLLDDYERESGMKIELTKNGFAIPIGPNMEATMQISLRQ